MAIKFWSKANVNNAKKVAFHFIDNNFMSKTLSSWLVIQ